MTSKGVSISPSVRQRPCAAPPRASRLIAAPWSGLEPKAPIATDRIRANVEQLVSRSKICVLAEGDGNAFRIIGITNFFPSDREHPKNPKPGTPRTTRKVAFEPP
jgi:hypothetical protein